MKTFDYTRAACRTYPHPDIFHPEDGDRATTMLAVTTCQQCPMVAACLANALAFEAANPSLIRSGIWGATTPSQRAKMAREAKRVMAGAGR